MRLDKTLGIAQCVLVLAFVVAAFSISQALRSSYKPPGAAQAERPGATVKASTLSPESYTIQLRTSGVVSAKANVDVVPEVSGRVVFVDPNFFQDGSFEAGQVLFKIDASEFELNVQKSIAEVQRAEASLRLSKAEVDSAKFNWQQNNGDKPIPALVAKEPQLQRAEADLRSAKANLAVARLQLERTEFSLPFSGRVVTAQVSVGNFVAAGKSYGQVFDLSALEVNASLDEQQLRWLINAETPKVFMSYSLFGAAQMREGQYERGAASLDGNTRFASVNFSFLEVDSELIPGTFVDINMQGERLENIYRIPIEAQQTSGQLWVVDDGGLKSWAPEILHQSDEYIIVPATGQNIRIVISRVGGAFEGMPVKVLEETL